jgi:hypothetical protein
MILVDTSGVVALLDRGEREHERVHGALTDSAEPLVTIDLVVAEADYLILTRLGRAAEREFVQQLLDGVFLREPLSDGDLRRAHEIADRFHDQDLGLTDASLMAVAERLRARGVLTLDRRHFAPFRDRRGWPLDLLP